MTLHEEIQNHLLNLPLSLQEQVLDFVVFLETKNATINAGNQYINEDDALKFHEQLMDQYSDAFEKLAQ